MKKGEKTQEKVNYLANQIESGIEEIAKDEGLRFEANTYIKKATGNMPPSVFVMQNFAMQFSKHISLSSSTNRILWFLIGLTEYENFISIDQLSLSEELKISLPTIVRGLKELKELNIIISIPHRSDKRRNDYFINPNTMWRGNSFNRTKKVVSNKNILELPFYTIEEKS
jgi:Firmicute plasmid replication protein (RepL)